MKNHDILEQQNYKLITLPEDKTSPELSRFCAALEANDLFIAGGFVRELLYPTTTVAGAEKYRKPMDVDIFHKVQPDQLDKVPLGKVSIVTDFLQTRIKYYDENTNGITWKVTAPEKLGIDCNIFLNKDVLLQEIRPILINGEPSWGTPEEVINRFDYTVVQCALMPDGKTALVSDRFIEDNENKFLRINNMNGFENSCGDGFRLLSYYAKGYSTNNREVIKYLPGDWISCGSEIREQVLRLMRGDSGVRLTLDEILAFEKMLFTIFESEHIYV